MIPPSALTISLLPLSSCNITHILFNCPYIFSQRKSFLSLIDSLNIPANPQSIISRYSQSVILSTLDLFNQAGFIIKNKFKKKFFLLSSLLYI